MKKTSRLLLLITAAVLLPALSRADIMFIPGNNPQPDEENVLLNQGETGNTVTGSTNQSHIGVNFSSTQTLTIPSNGQARIEATSGGSQVALSDIAFALASGTLPTRSSICTSVEPSALRAAQLRSRPWTTLGGFQVLQRLSRMARIS